MSTCSILTLPVPVMDDQALNRAFRKLERFRLANGYSAEALFDLLNTRGNTHLPIKVFAAVLPELCIDISSAEASLLVILQMLQNCIILNVHHLYIVSSI